MPNGCVLKAWWDPVTSPSETRKRSLSLMGHQTSVSLENAFWEVLDQAAQERGISLAHLVKEVDATRMGNLSSALRLYALEWVKRDLI